MATFLAYLEPVPGRLYPLVATLQEVARRGRRIIVRSGPAEVDLLRSIGMGITQKALAHRVPAASGCPVWPRLAPAARCPADRCRVRRRGRSHRGSRRARAAHNRAQMILVAYSG